MKANVGNFVGNVKANVEIALLGHHSYVTHADNKSKLLCEFSKPSLVRISGEHITIPVKCLLLVFGYQNDPLLGPSMISIFMIPYID